MLGTWFYEHPYCTESGLLCLHNALNVEMKISKPFRTSYILYENGQCDNSAHRQKRPGLLKSLVGQWWETRSEKQAAIFTHRQQLTPISATLQVSELGDWNR